MAEFGAIADGEASVALRYQSNFGNIPNGTVYLDRLSGLKAGTHADATEIKAMSIDRRTEIKAALTTTSALFATGTNYSGTSGSIPVILPTVVDAQLYDQTLREYPLATGGLPRVTNQGLWADIVKRTAMPAAKWKAEGAALDSAASTYSRAVTAIKYVYATGELTGPVLVASRVWNDARRMEVEGHYNDLKEHEEDTIINGNPTTGTTDGTTSDENAFQGLIQKITTNTNNKSSTKIALDEIRVAFQTIYDKKGKADLCVTDMKTLNDIKGLIQEVTRYPAPTYNIQFGIQNIEFEGVPIIVSPMMPTTGNGREFLVLSVKKQNNIQMRVLQDATFEELAKTADSYKFMIKEYITLVVVFEDWCYRIYNLA